MKKIIIFLLMFLNSSLFAVINVTGSCDFAPGTWYSYSSVDSPGTYYYISFASDPYERIDYNDNGTLGLVENIDYPYVNCINTTNNSDGDTLYAKDTKQATIDSMKSITCPSGEIAVFNGADNDLTCSPPCTPAPQPYGIMIASYNDIASCQEAVALNSIDINGTKYSNLQCWENTCIQNDLKPAKLFGVFFPDNFPDSSKKGIRGIHSGAGLDSSECIKGTTYDTDIRHVEVLGYDENTNICKYATYTCNDGLTWNKENGICEIPSDEANLTPDNSDISSELALSCSSGKWAKSWTFDYCGNDLCYIGLSEQGYDLQCGRKYIEYDCTSDYRIKYFKQVSCGAIAKDDFDQKNLDIGEPDNHPPGSTSNDTNLSSAQTKTISDGNSTVTDFSGVVKIIHDDLTGIDSSLGNLVSSSTITNVKLSQANSKLGSIDSKLGSIDGKLEDIKKGLNPQTDSDENALNDSNSNALSFLGDVQNSLGGIETKFNETKTLINSGFTYTPPSVGSCVDPSTVVYGKQIQLSICEPMQKFSPIFYLIFTVVFSYIAILIFILGFKL